MQKLTEKRSKSWPILLIEIMQVAAGSVVIFWPTVCISPTFLTPTFDSVPISTAYSSEDFIW